MTSAEEGDNTPEKAEEEEREELEFEPPAHYITIRVPDDGPVELDIGDFGYYSARGLLHAAVEKMREREPYMDLRAQGISLDEQELRFLGDLEFEDDDEADDNTDEGDEGA